MDPKDLERMKYILSGRRPPEEEALEQSSQYAQQTLLPELIQDEDDYQAQSDINSINLPVVDQREPPPIDSLEQAPPRDPNFSMPTDTPSVESNLPQNIQQLPKALERFSPDRPQSLMEAAGPQGTPVPEQPTGGSPPAPLSEVPSPEPVIPNPAAPAPQQQFDPRLMAFLDREKQQDQELLDAQSRADRQRSIGTMLEGVDLMGQGISRAPKRSGAFDHIRKGADQSVKDLLLRRKDERDKQSARAKLYESIYGKPLNPYQKEVLQQGQTGLDLKREEMRRKSSKGGEAEDKAFAKDLVPWKAGGGYSGQLKNLDQLEDVIKEMEDTKGDFMKRYSGSVRGILPDKLRVMLNEKAVAAGDRVRNTVTATLRATLGAQFTEKEGERIFRQSWNPQLSPEENIKNIKRIHKQLKRAVRAKEKLSKYWESHGRTLSGAPALEELYSAQADISSGMPSGGSSGYTPSDKDIDNMSEAELKAYLGQ